MRRARGQSLAEFAIAALLFIIVVVGLVLVFGAGEIFGALGMLP